MVCSPLSKMFVHAVAAVMVGLTLLCNQNRYSVSGFAFTVPRSARPSPVLHERQQANMIPSTWSVRVHQQMRVFETRSRVGRVPHAVATARRSPSMVQEPLILTEENVIAVLAEAKTELSTIFGNNAENTSVGITGDCEFVCLDGPSVVVRLTGRFWHERSTVLSRVANFVLSRIPECVDVEIEDPAQLEDADPQGRGQGAEM